MKYLSTEDIRYLQVDHNSTCNLRCPQCARNHNGETLPGLPQVELSVSDYEKMITPNLETIMFCGNYGEVIVSETFLPTIKWLINESTFKGKIIVTSNGSARDRLWWTELAQLLKGRGKVNFSIDGLADTNHLYRVNSNFDKIIENASAFIDAGGKARWDFLVFGHNEHQVDDAIKLAQSLGFEQFQIKLTNRFINDEHYKNKKIESDDIQIVQSKRSQYILNMPAFLNYQGKGKEQNEKILEDFGSWTNYVNKTSISCKWQNKGQIFIDFEGRVWPCTWTASGYYHHDENNTQKIQSRKILDHYGWNFNSVRHHTLEEILNHEYFAEKLCGSWNGSTEDAIPKLVACGRTCGTHYEFSSVHGGNNQLIEFNKEL